jgi:hypothetical protein
LTRRIPLASTILAIAIAALALPRPASFAVLALGFALLVGAPETIPVNRAVRRWACWILCGAAVALGLSLLVPSWNSVGELPGRAAWLPAVSTIVLAAAIAMSQSLSVRCRRLAVKLALAASIGPWIALLGYLVALDPFSAPVIGPHTGLSAPGAIAMLVLAVGVLGLWPDHGFVALARSPSAGGLLVRMFLPAALAFPVLIDWVLSYGEAAQWFGREFRLALDLGATSLLFAGLVMWIGILLKRRDAMQNELLTICAWSKRVLDHGKWIEFEEFLLTRLHIQVTHGISDESSDDLLTEMLDGPHSPPKAEGGPSR